jgi:serine/threonine protein kinase
MEFYFNKEICNLTKEAPLIAIGGASYIYKIDDDKIVKVSFLKDDDITKKEAIEYFICEKINTIPELKELTVPYYGGSFCYPKDESDKYKLYLIFKYIPFKTIFEQFDTLRAKDYEIIINQLQEYILKFNNHGIKHNDLHAGNIFYDPIKKQILLTDWNAGSFGYENENINYWSNIIKNQFIIETIFKQIPFSKFKKVLVKLRTSDNKNNLYQDYISKYNIYKKRALKRQNKDPNFNIDNYLNNKSKDIIGSFYLQGGKFVKYVNKTLILSPFPLQHVVIHERMRTKFFFNTVD